MRFKRALSIGILGFAVWAAGFAPATPVGGGGAARALPTAAEAAPGELLVAFDADVPAASWPALVAAAGGELVERYALTAAARVRAPAPELDGVWAALAATPGVRRVERNAPLRVAQEEGPETEPETTAPEAVTPDDPMYGPDQAWFYELLGAPQGWAITTGDPSVVVAVLDGAVDLDHPELAGKIWTNADEIPDNGVDDDGNGYVDDVHGYDFVGAYGGPGDRVTSDNDPDAKAGDPAAGDGEDQDGDGVPDGAVGHGTQVAGIIAATGNNAEGLAGVAWNVTIMPLRVTGPEGNGFFSSFMEALEYAVANGATVVNISLESKFLPLTVEDAVKAAAEAGLIMVAAGGNTGFTVSFPASLADIIAVGSTRGRDEPDLRALFSPVSGEVEVVAPGVDIPAPTIVPVTGEPSYAPGTGTSFSAPLVTGTVALLKSIRPTATLADVRLFLRDGAVDLPDTDAPLWDGFGRLGIGATLAAALAGPLPAPVLDGAVAGEGVLSVEGRAAPDAMVSVSALGAEAPLGIVPAGPTGRFRVAIELESLAETTAVLDLVATAEAAAGVSPPSRTLRVPVPRDVVLYPGWNLVSWAGETGSGEAVLGALPPAVARVFAWVGSRWEVHQPGSAVLRLDEVATGQGLWVFVSGPQSVVWRQARAPYASVDLAPGWQLAAWPGPTAAAAETLAFTAAEVEALFTWAPLVGGFRSFRPALPGAATLDTVPHLEAVWLLVREGGRWPGP